MNDLESDPESTLEYLQRRFKHTGATVEQVSYDDYVIISKNNEVYDLFVPEGGVSNAMWRSEYGRSGTGVERLVIHIRSRDNKKRDELPKNPPMLPFVVGGVVIGILVALVCMILLNL